MSLRTIWVAAAIVVSAAAQTKLPRMNVDEALLRVSAYLYPVPEYPPASIKANHAGRVVVEVVVAPDGNNFTYARVQSSKVLEAPDPDMANAVLEALNKSRYTPIGDRRNGICEAVGRVIWEFRITDGKPEVLSIPLRSNTPHPGPALTTDDLRIVQRARQILASESVWNRADTRECPADLKVFSLYCALEKATQEISSGFDHRGIVMEAARAVIDEIAPGRDYDHRLMGYNNDPTTTFPDIQKVLRLTEDQISKRINANPQKKN